MQIMDRIRRLEKQTNRINGRSEKDVEKKENGTEKWLGIIARGAELMSWGYKPSISVLMS